MTAYYNEFDPQKAAWLRELIKAGVVAPGDVDERSISDVRPDDLKGYTQAHFFAGIGLWSYALRLAGWSDDRPVWTGSCPCPPFSSAGKQYRCDVCDSTSNLCHPRKTGYFICLDCGNSRYADERHLWPEFSRLISKCRPATVLGEQVASKDGRSWLDVVSADMENMGYGLAGADLCAAGVGAPHIRQRLFFCGMADADCAGLFTGREGSSTTRQWHTVVADDGARRMGDTHGEGVRGRSAESDRPESETRDRVSSDAVGSSGATNHTHTHHGGWRDVDWIGCRDGKFRPVEPGTFPLVDGSAARVLRLCGYGDGIVPQVAQAFIEAVM